MRLPLIIINETAWDTGDIRAFVLAGLKSKGALLNKSVRIVYGKGHALWGCAALGRNGIEGQSITLSLPGPAYVKAYATSVRAESLGITDPIRYLELAQVLEHEIDHTLGLEHRDMLYWPELKPTWHEGLAIRWRGKFPREATPTEVVAEQRMVGLSRARERRTEQAAKREAKAREHLAQAEKDMERAKARVLKWKMKVAYYNRKKGSSDVPDHS